VSNVTDGQGRATRPVVHADSVAEPPILLRLYEGCARGYISVVQGANIIKLANDQPKVSYLSYRDFDRDPHPALAASVSVNLKTFRIRQRLYPSDGDPPILHRKELFVGPDHPDRAKFARLTRGKRPCGRRDSRGHRLVRRRGRAAAAAGGPPVTRSIIIGQSAD
jgi:DNA phosphorothioation-associated putative methyltransferase